MTFQVNVTLDASEALVGALNNIAAALAAGAAVSKAAGTSKTRTPKATVEEKDNGASEQGSVDAAETVVADPATAETPSTVVAEVVKTEVTVEQVRAAVAALAKANREKAVAILKAHGADSVSALKPEHYVSVLKEVAGV